MKVSIVIPNFNGEEILKRNLPRVIESASRYAKDKSRQTEIIVVDDGSLDKSTDVIREIIRANSYPFISIKLLENSVNRGFSSTVNKGAKEAQGEFLVLLNTDAYPEKNEDFFSKAFVYFDNPDFFAVGFMDKSVETDGRVVLRGRGVGRWKRGFLLHRRGEVNKANTLWVSGGSSAYRRSIWNELGGMNELYNPFYWEDIDLSYRAQKRGYKIAFESQCVVVHEHEKGAIKKSRSRFIIQTISYRNQLQFVWLNATDTFLLISHICWLPFHLLNTLFRGDFAFLFGLLKALIRLPKIAASRVHAKKKAVVSDREVVEAFTNERIE